MPRYNGGSSGGASGDIFKTISVSGQSDVVADSATDGLTFVAGSNMTITTDASGDEVTFTAAGGTSLANGVDNRLVTASSASALNGEANLTFDGSLLTLSSSATTTDVFDITANSVTTAKALDISATGLTTGMLLSLTGTSSAPGVQQVFVGANLTTTHTGTGTSYGAYFNVDKTGVTGASTTSRIYGVAIDLDDSATNHASGNSILTGLDVNSEFAESQGNTRAIGLSASASGAANNYGIVVPSGSVGIGTDTPTSSGLHVKTTEVATATAKVNGATSSTNAVVVDNNVGTIVVGMLVTGPSISQGVTVLAITDQNNFQLSHNQSLANNEDLVFTEPTTALHFESTANYDANFSPVMTLSRTGSSQANSDGLGAIHFQGKESGGVLTTYAKLRTSIRSTSSGGSGKFELVGLAAAEERIAYRYIGGQNIEFNPEGTTDSFAIRAVDTTLFETDSSNNTWAFFGSTGGYILQSVGDGSEGSLVVNDRSDDLDFRVESVNEAYMFFVDAATNRISIGDSEDTPAATLEITNNASAGAFGVPLLQLNNNDVDQIAVDINAANTTADVIDITANAVTSGKIIDITSSSTITGKVIDISADGLTTGKVIDIDANGAMTTGQLFNATSRAVPDDTGGGSLVDTFKLTHTVASNNNYAHNVMLLDIDNTHHTDSGKTSTLRGLFIDIDAEDTGGEDNAGTQTTIGAMIDVYQINNGGTSTNIGLDVTAVGNVGDTTYSIKANQGSVLLGCIATGEHLELRGPSGTGTASAALMVFSTVETSIVADDHLGRIEFKAGNEAGGSDAILTGASITAIAEAEFTSSVNSTALVFSTGTSGAATEKVRIDKDGNVGIGTNSPLQPLDVRGADDNDISIIGSGSIGVQNSAEVTPPSNRAWGFLSIDTQSTMVAGNIRLDDGVTGGSHAGYNHGTVDRGGAGIIFGNTNGSTGTIQFVSKTDTNDDTWVLSESMRIDGSGNVGIGTTSPDANAKLSVEGAISLDEISAPSNTADRGQLYTNADNHLHFINGAGTDIKVTEEVFIVALSDHSTDLAASTSTSVASLIMPFGMTITEVSAFVNTAPSGETNSTAIIVDIHKLAYNSGLYNGTATTIMSSDKIEIDENERNSIDALAQNTLTTTSVAQHDELTFFIDQVGSSTKGRGLKAIIKGVRV